MEQEEQILYVVADSGVVQSIHHIDDLKKYKKDITLICNEDDSCIKAAIRYINMLVETDVNVTVLMWSESEDPDCFIRNYPEYDISAHITDQQLDIVEFLCSALYKEKDSVVKKSEAIETILSTIAKVSDLVKRELYFKEFTCIIDIDESVLRSKFNKILGIEEKPKTYYERTKESAGLRRILFFAKKHVAEAMGIKYTPEEDWLDEKCLHTFDEYKEEIRILKKELYAFINGATSVHVGDLNARRETYQEYMAHGEHKSVDDIYIDEGIPYLEPIVEFRYPYTQEQFLKNEDAALKEARKGMKRVIRSIDLQLNSDYSLTNEEIVILYRDRKEKERQMEEARKRRHNSASNYEDDLPF